MFYSISTAIIQSQNKLQKLYQNRKVYIFIKVYCFMQFQSSNPDPAKLAYDLRQIYAKLVGEHLVDVAITRKSKNYPAYFEALEDLYITTFHNFKTQKKNKKAKKPQQTYQTLKDAFIKIANDNQDAYLGRSQEPKPVGEIKIALNNIELYLWKKMKEAKMIGVKDSEEGLL